MGSSQAMIATPFEPTADPGTAFQEFLEQGTGSLVRLARSILRDEEAARDVVQDALFRAYLALDSFRFECNLKNWVRRIVVNQALKRLRRRKLRHRLTPWLKAEQFGAARPDPEKSAHLRQQVRILHEALDKLSTRQRTVLILRYQEGLSIPEIAEVMDIGPGTVKTHLVRAVRQVRALEKQSPQEVDHDDL